MCMRMKQMLPVRTCLFGLDPLVQVVEEIGDFELRAVEERGLQRAGTHTRTHKSSVLNLCATYALLVALEEEHALGVIVVRMSWQPGTTAAYAKEFPRLAHTRPYLSRFKLNALCPEFIDTLHAQPRLSCQVGLVCDIHQQTRRGTPCFAGNRLPALEVQGVWLPWGLAALEGQGVCTYQVSLQSCEDSGFIFVNHALQRPDLSSQQRHARDRWPARSARQHARPKGHFLQHNQRGEKATHAHWPYPCHMPAETERAPFAMQEVCTQDVDSAHWAQRRPPSQPQRHAGRQ